VVGVSRRLLLNGCAGSIIAGAVGVPPSAGYGQTFDVVTGCAAAPPFSISDVNKLFQGVASGPRPDVACFYYPSWYSDPVRRRMFQRQPGTEWDTVAASRPVVPCEIQPKVPLWGPFDASDPHWAEREIAAAANAGIDVFVYDWIYNKEHPVLSVPLERAFLHAANRRAIKFAVMWVNQDDPEARLDYQSLDWDRMINYALSTYMTQKNYWKVDGKPVFGIYQFKSLLAHYGGDALRVKVAELKNNAKRAGFPDLYLFCCIDYVSPEDPGLFGFDASTMYNALGLTPFGTNPKRTIIPFREAAAEVVSVWGEYANYQSIPFFPDCPVGWDNSARAGAKARMVVYRSAEQYEALLIGAKQFLWQRRYRPAILFLSSWNEWGEDHYLLPDRAYGDSYLKAVKRALAGKRTTM
jgi:hypothetical protein